MKSLIPSGIWMARKPGILLLLFRIGSRHHDAQTPALASHSCKSDEGSRAFRAGARRKTSTEILLQLVGSVAKTLQRKEYKLLFLLGRVAGSTPAKTSRNQLEPRIPTDSINESKRSHYCRRGRRRGGSRGRAHGGCTSVPRIQPGFGSDSRAAESARRSIYQPGPKRSPRMLY